MWRFSSRCAPAALCSSGFVAASTQRRLGSWGTTYNRPSPGEEGTISPLTILQDLKETIGDNGKIIKCDPRDMPTNELGHMVSPEMDQNAHNKLEAKAGDLFSKLPTPEDPMKAALMPTEEEMREREDYDAYKEALREKYRRSKQRGFAEAERLGAAMDRVAKGTYEPAPLVEKRAHDKWVAEQVAKQDKIDAAQKKKDDQISDLQAQLLEMQKKMRAMELAAEARQAAEEKKNQLPTEVEGAGENGGCFEDADFGDLTAEFQELVNKKVE